MTLQLTLFELGELEQSISSRQGFLANPLVMPEISAGRKTSVFCGRNFSELSQKLNQHISFSKTRLDSSPGSGESSSREFSMTFARQGMMSNGTLSPLPPLELLIGGIASGLLPTPTASDSSNRQPSATIKITKMGGVRHSYGRGKTSFMRLFQVAGLLRTPMYMDGKGFYVLTRQQIESYILSGRSLDHWAQQAIYLKNLSKGWANPRFSELMMGFPIGWTDLAL